MKPVSPIDFVLLISHLDLKPSTGPACKGKSINSWQNQDHHLSRDPICDFGKKKTTYIHKIFNRPEFVIPFCWKDKFFVTIQINLNISFG